MNPQSRTGVVLLNFGGPRHGEEVYSFLYEILRDPNTLQLPFPQYLQNVFARWIARRRSGEVRRQYEAIGGASPIVAASEAIRVALAASLKQEGQSLPVWVVHRYLGGWCARSAAEITAAGVERLVALPLYPHFSYATTGSSLQQLCTALRRVGYWGRLSAIGSYPHDAHYVAALAARLQSTLEQGNCRPSETVILCSAHGLPESYVRRGDPYPRELAQSREALQARFASWRFVLSYQSRVGPDRWLEPYTDRIIPELAAAGHKHIVFLPLSFVNDHIETLYEIGHTYFALAREVGMTPHLVPALETHPAYIAALTGLVQRGMREETVPKALLPPRRWFSRYGSWGLVGLAVLIWYLLG